MGDMGDDFNAFKKAGQQKRWRNLENSTRILKEHGIPFETYNNGIHLKVGPFDFWPSTGLYMHSKTQKTGRGVFNLIKESEVKTNGKD